MVKSVAPEGVSHVIGVLVTVVSVATSDRSQMADISQPATYSAQALDVAQRANANANVRTIVLVNFPIIPHLSPSVFIGLSVGFLAPPPLHRMRCLKEPRKIQRRRQNCTKAVSVLCCASQMIVSQASIRRNPNRSPGTTLAPFPRGKSNLRFANSCPPISR